jgi:hypothetical protein
MLDIVIHYSYVWNLSQVLVCTVVGCTRMFFTMHDDDSLTHRVAHRDHTDPNREPRLSYCTRNTTGKNN